MSSLLGSYYKWRLKTPQERVVKFQQKANDLLKRYNAKIVANVEIKSEKDEKLIKDRFNKLQEDMGVKVQANIQLIPENWDKPVEENKGNVDEKK